MKKIIFSIIAILISLTGCISQNTFNKYFDGSCLQIDYYRIGNATIDSVKIERFAQHQFWGGPHKNLIDTFEYGFYKIEITDPTSGKLLYSRTMRTLFEEWQSVPRAKKIDTTFEESICLPYPKNEIKITFLKRNKKTMHFEVQTSILYNPQKTETDREDDFHFKTKIIRYNGKSDQKVDLVFLAEGYRKKEMKKFLSDVNEQINYLFQYEPFKNHINDFNVYAILSTSENSGTDIPQDSIFKNTVLNSHFNTFGIDRYLTIANVWKMYEIASEVPFDQIFVIVNTPKYGGGGFYNFMNITVADNLYAKIIMVHEFGHGFGGLADEYWTSEVATEDYYNLNKEPAEPNITTLVNFEKKWKNMVPNSVPIPTPNTKKYKNTIGAFEGGGYCEKGIYRPMQTCIMKTLKTTHFCLVCQNIIENVINFYCDKK